MSTRPVLTPAKRKRIAAFRKGQDQRWRAQNGPVASYPRFCRLTEPCPTCHHREAPPGV